MKKKVLHLMCTVLLLGWAVTAVQAELVGHWPLDEGTGGTAFDVTGNGNDGTLRGDPEWVAGVFKSGLHFDHDDDVDCGNDASLDITGPISISIWINPDKDESAAIAPLCKATSGAGGWSWQLRYGWSSPQPDMGFQFNATGGRVWVYANQELTVGEWYHFAAAHDGSVVKCYVNGMETDSQPMTDFAGGASPLYIGQDGWNDNWEGALDDVRLYDHGLSPAEVIAAMKGSPPELGANPVPENEAIDVPRQVILSWEPGEFAQTHNVYFSTVFNDVTEADTDNPLNVLVSQGQSELTYDAGILDFGQTYYWRVDEVNGAPDNTVFKGEVWSFTVEPFSIPIAVITATASSTHDAEMIPEKTIDSSGLDELDQHTNDSTDMWLSGTGDQDIWIQYEFDKAYKLHEMWVWNSNQSIESFLGLGAKEVTIEISSDGDTWTPLDDVPPFAQATARPDYTHNTTVDFGGALAKFVKIKVNSGYGPLGQYGLNEVRFFHIPTFAREPMPADQGSSAGADVNLTWRAGREAASHQVYLGTDAQTLSLVGTVDTSTFSAQGLDYDQTYFWQVTEVNEAETPSTYASELWSFAVPPYGVIDDFEAYDDTCNRIFFAWADGVGHSGAGQTPDEGLESCGVPAFSGNGTGSIVGHASAPFAEKTIVHSGRQSMPLAYDNATGPSEATLMLDALDWTASNIKALSLYFRGEPGNSGQLYVKINNTPVNYDALPDALQRAQWTAWNIDLSKVAGDLENVTQLTIGVAGAGAAGMVYVDDIRVYPLAPEFITPVEPAPANLKALYAFDGNANDSVGGLHGTLVGIPEFVPGQQGQALSLNTRTVTDYVQITGYQGILGASAITVAAWVKTSSTATGAIIGWGPNTARKRFGFRIDAGRLRTEHHGGNVQGDTVMNDDTWHHVAVTVQANATISHPEVQLWLDGQDDTRPTTDPDTYDLSADQDVSIGRRPASDDRYFIGQIDELYIFDRALSRAEIAGLAGLTQPFDKPFADE